MVNLQLVLLHPVGKLGGREALVPLVGCPVHQEALAGGGGKRINNIELSLGKALGENLRRIPGGVVCARNTGGEAEVDNIHPLLQKRREKGHVLRDVGLRGAGHGTGGYLFVEGFKGNRRAEVLQMLLLVQKEMERDDRHISFFIVFFGEISRHFAAENVVTAHSFLHTVCKTQSVMA